MIIVLFQFCVDFTVIIFYFSVCIDFTLIIVLFQVLPFAEIMISTAGREHFELYLERDGNESLLGYNLFVCLFCICFL